MDAGSARSRDGAPRWSFVLGREAPPVGERPGDFPANGPGSVRCLVSTVPPLRKGKGPAGSALPRRLCSLADAARYLAVSVWTVRQMVWRGDLPHIKTGKRILLDLRDLDGWIDREKVRGV